MNRRPLSAAPAPESGVQDQLCAAFGGMNFIEVEAYPRSTVHTIPLWDELSSRLTLVSLGSGHDSSGLHRQVIDQIRGRRSEAFDAEAVALRGMAFEKLDQLALDYLYGIRS